MMVCCHTTPSIWTVGRASAATVTGVLGSLGLVGAESASAPDTGPNRDTGPNKMAARRAAQAPMAPNAVLRDCRDGCCVLQLRFTGFLRPGVRQGGGRNCSCAGL